MEKESESFWELYTGYLLSIVKIKREIKRDRGKTDRHRERERERARNNKKKINRYDLFMK